MAEPKTMDAHWRLPVAPSPPTTESGPRPPTIVERLLRDRKVLDRRRLHRVSDHPRARRAVDRAEGSAGAESARGDGAAGRLGRRRAGLSARHRRARPRRALAGDLRHAGVADGGVRRRRARLPDRLAARTVRRLFRRDRRRDHLLAGRCVDGVSAGAAVDPAGRDPRHRAAFGHRRHRRHRLDAVLPRGAHRGESAGADGLRGRGAHRSASRARRSCSARFCPMSCRF